MTDKTRIEVISPTEIDNAKIANLPTRPNAPPAMGGSGMSPQQLRERFDALAMLAINRINALIKSIQDSSIAQHISSGIPKDANADYSLLELFAAIENGTFADILKVCIGEEEASLDTWLEAINSQIQNFQVDENYDPESPRAQSGNAVKEAIHTVECLTLTKLIEFQYPSIAELTKKDEYGFLSYANSFHVTSFNRPPVVGELFVSDCVSADKVPCTIIAQVKEINDQGFAAFKIVSLQLTNQEHIPDSTNPDSGKAVSQAIDMLFGQAKGKIINAEHVSSEAHDVTVTLESLNFGLSSINTDRISYQDGVLTVQSPGGADTGKTLAQLCPDLKEGASYILSIDTTLYDPLIKIGEKAWYNGTSLTITADDLKNHVWLIAGLTGSITVSSISATPDPNKVKVFRYKENDTHTEVFDFVGDTCTFPAVSPKMTVTTDVGVEISVSFKSSLPSGGNGGASVVVDQNYDSTSTNPQSGTAVADAFKTHNAADDAHPDIRQTIANILKALQVDGTDIDTLAEIITYINSQDASVLESIASSIAGKLDASALTSAINTALAQAKSSGEFDGAKGDKGDKGDTPQKGVDYFTEADKAEMAAMIIESLGGSPVFGYVDSETNNIVLSGNIPDGEYTLKYELADGSTIDIGNIVLDAEEDPDVPDEPDNLFRKDNGYILNGRTGSDGTDRTDANGYVLSNYIKVSNGDTVYVNKPINGTTYSGFKFSNGSSVGVIIPTDTTYVKNYSSSNEVSQFTINNASVEYVRITIVLNNTNTPLTEEDVDNAGIIITVNEPIM